MSRGRTRVLNTLAIVMCVAVVAACRSEPTTQTVVGPTPTEEATEATPQEETDDGGASPDPDDQEPTVETDEGNGGEPDPSEDDGLSYDRYRLTVEGTVFQGFDGSPPTDDGTPLHEAGAGSSYDADLSRECPVIPSGADFSACAASEAPGGWIAVVERPSAGSGEYRSSVLALEGGRFQEIWATDVYGEPIGDSPERIRPSGTDWEFAGDVVVAEVDLGGSGAFRAHELIAWAPGEPFPTVVAVTSPRPGARASLQAGVMLLVSVSDEGDAPLATPEAHEVAVIDPRTGAIRRTTRPAGERTPEEAAVGLYQAWLTDDRTAARDFATEDVIDEVFPHPGGGLDDHLLTGLGCRQAEGGHRCILEHFGGGRTWRVGTVAGERRVTGQEVVAD